MSDDNGGEYDHQPNWDEADTSDIDRIYDDPKVIDYSEKGSKLDHAVENKIGLESSEPERVEHIILLNALEVLEVAASLACQVEEEVLSFLWLYLLGNIRLIRRFTAETPGKSLKVVKVKSSKHKSI